MQGIELVDTKIPRPRRCRHAYFRCSQRSTHHKQHRGTHSEYSSKWVAKYQLIGLARLCDISGCAATASVPRRGRKCTALRLSQLENDGPPPGPPSHPRPCDSLIDTAAKVSCELQMKKCDNRSTYPNDPNAWGCVYPKRPSIPHIVVMASLARSVFRRSKYIISVANFRGGISYCEGYPKRHHPKSCLPQLDIIYIAATSPKPHSPYC